MLWSDKVKQTPETTIFCVFPVCRCHICCWPPQYFSLWNTSEVLQELFFLSSDYIQISSTYKTGIKQHEEKWKCLEEALHSILFSIPKCNTWGPIIKSSCLNHIFDLLFSVHTRPLLSCPSSHQLQSNLYTTRKLFAQKYSYLHQKFMFGSSFSSGLVDVGETTFRHCPRLTKIVVCSSSVVR